MSLSQALNIGHLPQMPAIPIYVPNPTSSPGSLSTFTDLSNIPRQLLILTLWSAAYLAKCLQHQPPVTQDTLTLLLLSLTVNPSANAVSSLALHLQGSTILSSPNWSKSSQLFCFLSCPASPHLKFTDTQNNL